MSAIVDCKCDCDRCVSRTTDVYRLNATCTNCGSEFIAEMRSGDKRPLSIDCPRCGVHTYPLWGGIA